MDREPHNGERAAVRRNPKKAANFHPRERPTADRVFEIIGATVIVLILAVAIATAFTMSNVLGVLGLLILVVVVGVLFSRRFG
jgi:membrane glycosyltransferase